MQITMMINGQRITDDIKPDMLLLDFLRAHGCYSVNAVVKQAIAGYVRFG